MKNGMSLEALLTEVVRQNETKRDFIASTKESIRMVQQEGQLWIVLLKEGSSELERFQIAETAQRQIAGRLGIPWAYYARLLNDHPDLVMTQVNALFEREPETRLMRTLDGKVRAFLSNRYRRLDNAEILEKVLPPMVKGEIATTLMSSNVGENKMHMKILFTDDSLAIDLGATPNGQKSNGWLGQNADVDAQHRVIARRDAGRDIVRPGVRISNSETGHGGLNVEGFLFRSYCLNGVVWGGESAFTFSRNHVGGKLMEGDDFEIFSDETRRKQDEVILSEVADAFTTMVNPERVRVIGERLRAVKNGEKVGDAFAAVDTAARELDVREGEKQSILTTFLKDGDFSQWGMVNAVTELANSDDVSYERACELENIGAQILQFNQAQWHKIATAEKVAA